VQPTIYLADTNVISEFVSAKPHTKVMRWLQSVDSIAVSVITVEEARFGLSWHANPHKLALFNAVVAQAAAVYPVTESVAERAGVLRGRLQAQGITRTPADMLIAATALEHRLVIATRNVKDFSSCGVEVVNPFTYAV
jgi:predicted nucleic acid-binding protein